jgi:hypothetical protein
VTSIVSQPLVGKCKETPLTEDFHEDPKREKKKPKIDPKTELEMGECSYSKTYVPFLCGGQGGHQAICQGSICY